MKPLKPYDEIEKAIDYSSNIKDLEICSRMLESRKEFIVLEDYEQLKEVINLKKKIWTQ